MEDDLRLDPYSQEEGSEILEDLLNNFNRIGENQGGDDEQEAEDQEIDILELLSSYGRSSFSSALPSTSSASQGARAIRKITNSLYSLFLFSLHLSFELQ